ncbi:MAG: hypothetical protein ABF335_03280 [Alphaproteobacteria bacterium]
MTRPDRLNDGTNAAPYLRKDMNIGTMLALPTDSGAPALDFADQGPVMDFLKAHDYLGIQSFTPGVALAAGFSATGMASFKTLDDPIEQTIADHAAKGYDCTTVHAGTGFETDDEMAQYADLLLNAASKHNYAVYVETHRATITQDIKRTVDLVEKFPELRFNADLSHWYTGHEMNTTNFDRAFAFMDPVLERVRFIHGRIGNSGSLQVDFRPDDQVEFIDHFEQMWTRCFEGFLREAKPGDYLPFAPELLPASFSFLNPPLNIHYARMIRQSDGTFHEEGNRWQQAEMYYDLAMQWFNDTAVANATN